MKLALLAFARRLRRDDGGSILFETAFVLSVLTTMTLGGLETARYVLLHQRMDRVAASTGDLITRAQALTAADVDNVFDAVEHVAKPFNLGTSGLAIVSSVSRGATGPAVINWQRNGAGTYAAGSRIGTPGGAPSLPPGFAIGPGDSIIVTEVYYTYSPWIFKDLISPTEIYYSSFMRPRFASLTTLN